MLMFNNRTIAGLVKPQYSLAQVDAIFSMLRKHGTFSFVPLANGLFPAAALQRQSQYTGYDRVWVRDNFYVAYAHYLNGEVGVAVKTVRAIASFFTKHRWRLEKIVAGELDFHEPMNRPHIRFNGSDLTEIEQKWAHAENDALGYFVWFLCRLCNEAHYVPTDAERELLALFVFYFETIRYWQDEDSGHWEETRKIEASSIGVVVRALEEFKALAARESAGFGYAGRVIAPDLLDALVARGRESLSTILPAECVQPDPARNRRYDAALLFLVFPMEVAAEPVADQIVSDVATHLQGDYGICRYRGDSFWSADYKTKMARDELTTDFSDDISRRDRLLVPGQEAQWCIFDPIVSVIYGLRYQRHRDPRCLQLQTEYFNRSLGHLTAEDSPFGAFRCPELYYLENGKYVPNDTVPLLWTQANLWMAFQAMHGSLEAQAGPPERLTRAQRPKGKSTSPAEHERPENQDRNIGAHPEASLARDYQRKEACSASCRA